jgi:hypothetical protein
VDHEFMRTVFFGVGRQSWSARRENEVKIQKSKEGRRSPWIFRAHLSGLDGSMLVSRDWYHSRPLRRAPLSRGSGNKKSIRRGQSSPRRRPRHED